MYIEPPSIINQIVNIDDLKILSNTAKLFKSNIIIYSKPFNLIFGMSQEYQDANVLKLLFPNDNYQSPQILKSIPNIACYGKDINTLLSIAEETHSDVTADCTSYMDINDYVLNLKCGSELKRCFDYFKYISVYDNIYNSELPNATLIHHYEDIKSIPEFNNALSAKSDEGIIKFVYDNFVYFIPPTCVKSLKSDVLDLNVYRSLNNTALLEFIIKRKKIGEIKIIYRTFIL